MANKRMKTNYVGVYYREAERVGKQGLEKIYYIVFKKDGKMVEEKVGRQYADNMTPAKASGIRAERIEGKRESRKEIKIKETEKIQAEKNRPTITFLWEQYLQYNKEKPILKAHQTYFRKYLTPFHNHIPSEIRTEDIRGLRKKIAPLLAPKSVKHVLSLLRTLINFGVKHGLCDDVPRSQLYFEMPKVDNQKTEMLTAEQLVAFEKALQEEPDQNAANFIRLALATGMRKTALMNLRWDDVDFYKGFITLRGEVAKKAKTERIPLSQTARAILQATQKIGNSEYVFPGKDGGPRREFRRVANRVKKKAGLPNDFRPLHGLRHAYASLLASSGKVDLYTLQKLLTHSSPTMTQRYAHLADEAMHRAASVVDDIFEKGE